MNVDIERRIAKKWGFMIGYQIVSEINEDKF